MQKELDVKECKQEATNVVSLIQNDRKSVKAGVSLAHILAVFTPKILFWTL